MLHHVRLMRRRANRSSQRWIGALGLITLSVLALGPARGLDAAPDGNPASEAVRPEVWSPVSEHWYVIEVNGERAGWMSHVVERDGSRVQTRDEVRMAIGRAGMAEVKVAMRNTFIETRDGRPVSAHLVQDMATQTTESVLTYREDGVDVVSTQGDRRLSSTKPLPQGAWLTPHAAERYFKERAAAGATQISFRVIMPDQSDEPVMVESALQGEGEIEHDGRPIPVTIWKTSMSAMAGMAMTEKYDRQGTRVYQELKAGLSMVYRLATREEALGPVRAAAPELLVKTFITVDRPIGSLAKARRATYQLRVKDGAMPELPSAGAQRVEPGPDASTARVTIDLDEAVLAPEHESADPTYLESSLLVDASDALVSKLAAAAVRGVGEDVRDRAQALRTAAGRHISAKGLETAFASASETARTRTGDCSEHAVLLCAMLRAQRVPARVAAGLVYVPELAGEKNVFGWHMWTQALVDGRWFDLDATLPLRFHIGHLLVATTPMADMAAQGELAALLRLIGNLEIEVVEVDLDKTSDSRFGVTADVPLAGAAEQR